MKTRILLLRHGETDWNAAHRMQGRRDIPLNERGRKQASCAAAFLADMTIDAVYASPLSRAVETAEIVKGKRDLPVIPEEGILEIDLGKWDGCTPEDMDVKFPGWYDIWRQSPDKAIPEGGETFRQVQERAVAAIKRIAGENQGKTVLLVSHMGCITSALIYFSGKSLDTLWKIPIANCGLSELEEEDGRWTVRSWGRADYIPEEYRPKHLFGRMRG